MIMGGGVINKSYVRYTEFARHMVLIISSHKLHRRLEYELLKYKALPRNIRRCFTLKFLIKRKYYSVLIRLNKANIIKTNTWIRKIWIIKIFGFRWRLRNSRLFSRQIRKCLDSLGTCWRVKENLSPVFL